MKSTNLIKLRNNKIDVPYFKVIHSDSSGSVVITSDYKEGLSDIIAVRSDSSLEDDKSYSFAGVFESFLNVNKDEAIEYIKRCYESKNSKKAIEYMELNGIDKNQLSMNVILQDMILGDTSGVIFTANPQGILNETVITVARSTCDLVVEDKIESTTYYYNTTDDKYYYVGSDDILSAGTIKELIELSNSIKTILDEELLDIEFTIEDGKIYILQARPITSMDTEEIYIYDSSNIVESYPNVSLPLTISFAKDIYTGVFKGVSRRIVGPKAADKLNKTLENMVDSKMGRMYYRIDNWYDVLKALPFSKRIIPVWQDMLGVKNHEYSDNAVELSALDRLRGYYNFFVSLKNSPKNMKKLNDTFTSIYEDFKRKTDDDLTPNELRELYNKIRGELFSIWDLTLINDMYAFIFTGLLKKKLKKKYPEDYEKKVNDMISGVINIESLKPVKSLENLVRLYNSKSNDYEKAFNKHVDDYGDRVVEELKLETKTFRTNPELLTELVKDYNLSGARKDKKHEDFPSGFFAKRALDGIKLREESRLNRSKIFGMLRTIVLKLADQYVKKNIIEEKDDIFYLTLDEIFLLIDKPFEVKSIIGDRKDTYDIYSKLPDYSRLVLTNNRVDKLHVPFNSKVYTSSEGKLVGTICSSGKVEGEAVVINKASDAVNTAGKVIITKMTDPGWVYILSSAKGIVTEKGSILSHTAIVSRELGIPSIVGVEFATDIIKTGDRVLVDADIGIVEVIS